MRKTTASGQFYAQSKEDLEKQIISCFKHNLGSGMPKIPFKKARIYGMVVPHAGYEYSGPCASHAYHELALHKDSFPDIFIILGPNHSGYGKSLFALSLEDFETPFGVVKNDAEFGKALIETAKQYNLGLQKDELAHNYEHSIEVQLPFLQFISGFVKKDLKIVPIVVSTLDFNKCDVLAKTIAKVASQQNKKIFIIASSDMTHYGLAYGFLHFPPKDAKANLKELDRKSINHILKLNSRDFYSEAVKTTICGTAAIMIAIEVSKALGSRKARLLKYYASGEISKDYDNAVGYASIIFE